MRNITTTKRAYKTNKALGGTFRWEAETEAALSTIMLTLGISKSDAVRFALRSCATNLPKVGKAKAAPIHDLKKAPVS
jgi:hypothetical protein